MHPEILSIALFWFVAAFTPGPNNVVASYSGFNFGITKTIPLILGVTLGFTSLIFFLTIGLINVFKIFPILQNILKYLGTLFLLYLAYKISFSKSSKEEEKKNPVTFFDTYFFQFLNPKGVIVAIIAVSTYVESGSNFISYSIWLLGIAFIFAVISIIFWTIIGKFMRKFATNEKFIKWFNYVMSALLLSCIATFYY